MTDLMRLYLDNRTAALEKIKNIDNAILMAELDDTIQLDLMRMANIDFAMLPQERAGLYLAIRRELSERLTTEVEECAIMFSRDELILLQSVVKAAIKDEESKISFYESIYPFGQDGAAEATAEANKHIEALEALLNKIIPLN